MVCCDHSATNEFSPRLINYLSTCTLIYTKYSTLQVLYKILENTQNDLSVSTYYIIREHSNFTNQLLTSNVQLLQENASSQLIDNARVQRARKPLEGLNGNRLHVQARSLHVHTQQPEGLEAFK